MFLVCLELSPTVRMSWRKASVSLSENVDQGLDADDGQGPCFRPPIEEVEDDAEDEELKEHEHKELSSVQVK